MKKVVIPGSFDPITLGHLNIIERTSEIFDEVTILIMKNINKSGFFNYEFRKELIQKSVSHLKNIKIDISEELLTKYMSDHNISTIVKGLRDVKDFDYEFEMANINKMLDPSIDTLFLLTDPKYSMISSTDVRELLRYNAPLRNFVPSVIIESLEKYQYKSEKNN